MKNANIFHIGGFIQITGQLFYWFLHVLYGGCCTMWDLLKKKLRLCQTGRWQSKAHSHCVINLPVRNQSTSTHHIFHFIPHHAHKKMHKSHTLYLECSFIHPPGATIKNNTHLTASLLDFKRYLTACVWCSPTKPHCHGRVCHSFIKYAINDVQRQWRHDLIHFPNYWRKGNDKAMKCVIL